LNKHYSHASLASLTINGLVSPHAFGVRRGRTLGKADLIK